MAAVKQYVKKPIPIEAIQWDGTNTKELMDFSKDVRFIYHDGDDGVSTEMFVQTIEGNMHSNIGDYLVRGVRGEFYVCAKDIFEETYTEVK